MENKARTFYQLRYYTNERYPLLWTYCNSLALYYAAKNPRNRSL